MSRFTSMAALLATLSDAYISRHKKARAQRFVFRHRRAHRSIASRLVRQQQRHMRLVSRNRNALVQAWHDAVPARGALKRRAQ